MDRSTPWLDAARDTFDSYRRMIDATIEQLTDEELHARPAVGINSVAIIVRHIGGNLRSRWTDFLTTDGEKPDRDRESEFLDWDGDRASLIAHLDNGWRALTDAIEQIDETNLDQPVFIRGELHSIPEALTRAITHLTYHVGQITLVARMVHDGPWQWLTIPPGESTRHNERTWGTSSSRSVHGSDSGSGGA